MDKMEPKKQNEAQSGARGSESQVTPGMRLPWRGAPGDISGDADLGLHPRLTGAQRCQTAE